jgi:dephospho-CoA kinase
MLKLGLTGGIGSGKSTVARILAVLGAQVIDADAISRHITAAQGAGIGALREAFGNKAIAADGSLDREWMRQLVFSDQTAKARLEKIVHPLVGQEIVRQTAQAQAARTPCLVLDIPLLVESGYWRERFHRILVVDCPIQTQIERVERRSKLSSDAVQAIIASQCTRQQRLQAADFVVYNQGKSVDEIGSELARLTREFGL